MAQQIVPALPENHINATVTAADDGIDWTFTDQMLVPVGIQLGEDCQSNLWTKVQHPNQSFAQIVAPSDPGGTGYYGATYHLVSSEGTPNAECTGTYLQILGHTFCYATDSVTILKCRPYTESIKVNVTFEMPGSKISSAYPPVPSGETAEFFSNAAWYPDLFIEQLNIEDGNSLEPYFQAFICGKDGTPVEELLYSPSRFLEASEHLYRVYAAQQYNAELRMPLSSDDKEVLLDATLTNSHRQRLIQSAVSTHIICGILVILFTCAVIAYLDLWVATRGTRRILPQSPTTIASVASLLVGSELLDSKEILPASAEFMSDRELKANKHFEDLKVSLGWWPGGRYGIDIGQAD